MSVAVHKAPRLMPDDAASIAADLYGLEVNAASLPSERDQNFLLTRIRAPLQSPTSPSLPNRDARIGASDSADRAERFVLKIANSQEALEMLDLRINSFSFSRNVAKVWSSLKLCRPK